VRDAGYGGVRMDGVSVEICFFEIRGGMDCVVALYLGIVHPSCVSPGRFAGRVWRICRVEFLRQCHRDSSARCSYEDVQFFDNTK